MIHNQFSGKMKTKFFFKEEEPKKWKSSKDYLHDVP